MPRQVLRCGAGAGGLRVRSGSRAAGGGQAGWTERFGGPNPPRARMQGPRSRTKQCFSASVGLRVTVGM